MRCRMETLTERVWDAPTMLGYVGQSGTTHDYTGKANAFRFNAWVIICPCVAQDTGRVDYFFL